MFRGREEDSREDHGPLRGGLLEEWQAMEAREAQQASYWNSPSSALETSLGDQPRDGQFCPSLGPSPTSVPNHPMSCPQSVRQPA